MLASLVEEIGELVRELSAVKKHKRKRETEGKADLELGIRGALFSFNMHCELLQHRFGKDTEKSNGKIHRKRYEEMDPKNKEIGASSY